MISYNVLHRQLIISIIIPAAGPQPGGSEHESGSGSGGGGEAMISENVLHR